MAATLLTAPVSAPAITPAAPTTQATAPAPKVDPQTEAYAMAQMARKDVAALFKARFGFDMPGGWNRIKSARAYYGVSFVKGTNGKACARWHYERKAGVAPAKTWTVAKLTQAITAEVTPIPRGKAAPGGLTVATARKMLTQAIKDGLVKADEAKGRSKWTGDQVKGFVLTNKLNELVKLAA